MLKAVLIFVLIIGLSLSQDLKRQCEEKHKKQIEEIRKNNRDIGGVEIVNVDNQACRYKCVVHKGEQEKIPLNNSEGVYPDYTACSQSDLRKYCLSGKCVPILIVIVKNAGNINLTAEPIASAAAEESDQE